MNDYIDKVGNLIEQTYQQNGNTKVVVIAHSMGNTYVLYLLNHKSKAWKDKFIQSYIALSGPWGGVIKIMGILASGLSFVY